LTLSFFLFFWDLLRAMSANDDLLFCAHSLVTGSFVLVGYSSIKFSFSAAFLAAFYLFDGLL
jgi:hypothetical protein